MRILASCLDRRYAGDPIAETIGLRGVSALCILAGRTAVVGRTTGGRGRGVAP